MILRDLKISHKWSCKSKVWLYFINLWINSLILSYLNICHLNNIVNQMFNCIMLKQAKVNFQFFSFSVKYPWNHPYEIIILFAIVLLSVNKLLWILSFLLSMSVVEGLDHHVGSVLEIWNVCSEVVIIVIVEYLEQSLFFFAPSCVGFCCWGGVSHNSKFEIYHFV